MTDEHLPKTNIDPAHTIPALANVERIGASSHHLMRGIDELEQYVEGPALPACQDLFDKNIRTTSSSANAANGLYINIDYTTLSDENKQIAEELGTPEDVAEDGSLKTIRITIPAEEAEDEAAVATQLASVAGQFNKQKLTWTPTYTMSEIKQHYGYEEHEVVSPGDFAEMGYFFDAETEKFHMSEELFKKSQETLEAETPLQLHREQVLLMTRYVDGAADHGQALQSYGSAMRQNQSLAQAQEIDPVLGDIMITAATIGSLTRNRNQLMSSGGPLTERLVKDMGMEREDASHFYKFQQHMAEQPNVGHISSALSSAMRYLKSREENSGEDTSKLRMAMLSSAFAATKDHSLRSAIYKDLMPKT